MAKLTAHGATVLYTATLDEDVTGDSLVFKRRTVRAYRSDGKLLIRSAVWFHPDRMYPKGRYHDYGWTVQGDASKTALPFTPEKWASYYREKGYTVKAGG